MLDTLKGESDRQTTDISDLATDDIVVTLSTVEWKSLLKVLRASKALLRTQINYLPARQNPLKV